MTEQHRPAPPPTPPKRLIREDVRIPSKLVSYKRQKRIAELEFENEILRDSLGFKKELVKIEALRQQAKGLEDFAESLMFRGCLENTFNKYDVDESAIKLNKQADELEKKNVII